MIQEAHVGVGVMGKEGAHAAMSSDFVIHRFHHLVRLLCLHGRWCYWRTTQVVFFSFYKVSTLAPASTSQRSPSPTLPAVSHLWCVLVCCAAELCVSSAVVLVPVLGFGFGGQHVRHAAGDSVQHVLHLRAAGVHRHLRQGRAGRAAAGLPAGLRRLQEGRPSDRVRLRVHAGHRMVPVCGDLLPRLRHVCRHGRHLQLGQGGRPCSSWATSPSPPWCSSPTST